jgi:hypothetical protein
MHNAKGRSNLTLLEKWQLSKTFKSQQLLPGKRKRVQEFSVPWKFEIN